jgi:hypothetical protein
MNRTGIVQWLQSRPGDESAFLVLVLLLCGDLAFIVLHTVNGATPLLEMPLLSLERDRGYPEMFQYAKYLWIISVLILVGFRHDSLRYLPWASVFAYFLLDDALQVHERVGQSITADLAVVPMLGLRLRDYGELAVSALAGIVLSVPLVAAYGKGSEQFRRVSRELALLILVLIFFGVVVDMLHVALGRGWALSFVLGIVEDGGEMLSVSVICWYVVMRMSPHHDDGPGVFNRVRTVRARRPT